MKLKILEFCLSPALGGLELFVKSSFESFEKETDCYICVAPDKKLDKIILSEKKTTLKRDKFFPFIPALKLAKFIDEKGIDIIHFHWTRDITTVVLAKLLSRKKPKIVQSRHMRMTRFKSDFYHKWLYSHIDMIHAVTKEVKEQLIKYIPQDIRPDIEMVYLGVETPNIDDKKVQELKKQYNLKDEFIVGIIGRIEEGKGQHLLVEAMVKLKDMDIKAFIVGSSMNDEYQNRLKSEVKKYKLEDKVLFSGFTDNVNEYMQLFDAVVLATTNETFGLVVIEAMANKKCVIAVDKGGPLEIIKDGVDGLLFERDSSALADKIELLYKDEKLKQKIALEGYNKVKKVFNKDIQMEKLYEKIYTSTKN